MRPRLCVESTTFTIARRATKNLRVLCRLRKRPNRKTTTLPRSGKHRSLKTSLMARIQQRGLRDFDWLLAFLAIGIVAFGTIQIRYAQPTEGYWVKQLIGLGIA